jgi:putative nucleotidyltransferase-like protein
MTRADAEHEFEVEHRRRSDSAAVEVTAALEAAGIRSILLKGPALKRWLYAEDEIRHYWDIDLLVSPEELPRAESVTAALGFEPLPTDSTRIQQESHHERWYRPRDNVCVELHRGFLGVAASDQQLWDELAQDTEPLPLGGAGDQVQIPGTAARTLLVGLHAAASGPEGTPLEDLVRAVRQVPGETWREAAELARKLHAEPALALGLSFVPEGAALSRQLELTGTASAEVILRGAIPPPTAMGFERLRQSPGLVGKLRYVVSELTPSSESLRHADPLARRGSAGMAAAYVLRPFRLAAQAPRGFLAWRSARRRAREQRE